MSRNLSDNDALKRLAFANPSWRITLGDAFSTGQYFENVAAGNTKEIVLKNPTEDMFFGVYQSQVNASAEARVSKAFNVTEDTEGNEPDTGITNKRSSKDGTVAEARTGGDGETGVYSGGTEFNDKGEGGGTGGGNATPGAIAGGYSNIIAPGDNMLVGVTNESSATMSYASIDIDWAEIPAGVFPA